VGRTTAVIDGNDNRTEYAYDDLGNLIKLTQADGTSLLIEFDEGSNPVKVTDPNGRLIAQIVIAVDVFIKEM
jgi:YD repeat-containing protein